MISESSYYSMYLPMKIVLNFDAESNSSVNWLREKLWKQEFLVFVYDSCNEKWAQSKIYVFPTSLFCLVKWVDFIIRIKWLKQEWWIRLLEFSCLINIKIGLLYQIWIITEYYSSHICHEVSLILQRLNFSKIIYKDSVFISQGTHLHSRGQLVSAV
jgi:hypothetical protein